jgi:hypothetical protein
LHEFLFRLKIEINRSFISAKEIRQWLSAPDSSKNYHESREKHQTTTCSWFLNGMRFRKLQEKADFLWIKGAGKFSHIIINPGRYQAITQPGVEKQFYGKLRVFKDAIITKTSCRFLSSSIIEKIIALRSEDESISYAYFFFDGRDSQKDLQLHDKLIRSLIGQLSLQCDGIPTVLVDLYGHGQQPSIRSLQDTLHQLISGLQTTYIIIDSLDECVQREKLLLWIDQIISCKMGNLHMVVASRPEREINDVLQSLDPNCVDLATESANHDITIYLEQQLSEVKKWDDETRSIIKSTLTMRAGGMYESLPIRTLKDCHLRQI